MYDLDINQSNINQFRAFRNSLIKNIEEIAKLAKLAKHYPVIVSCAGCSFVFADKQDILNLVNNLDNLCG